ncbi:MAG: hypothetical protein WC876_05445, partial [Candidatus Thermoplasmatota archaeon]
ALIISVLAGLAFVPQATAHVCYEAQTPFPNCGGCGQTPQFEIHAHVRGTGLGCFSAGFLDVGELISKDVQTLVQSITQVMLS